VIASQVQRQQSPIRFTRLGLFVFGRSFEWFAQSDAQASRAQLCLRAGMPECPVDGLLRKAGQASLVPFVTFKEFEHDDRKHFPSR
jgi:hypothetical protein